jgi:hypothetical protein
MSQAKGASRGPRPACWPKAARKRAQAGGIRTTLLGDLGEVAFVHKAMSLGLVVAKPYGQMHRYDFMVDGGHGLWRVQVKTCNCRVRGLYHVNVKHSGSGRCTAYAHSEVDFVVAYIMPEGTWYVLPVSEVVGRKSMLLRPKGFPRGDPYSQYREAWHLLGKPDGPAF